ncbi:laccase-4-like isoform X2 [Pseudomyrmex gracilis]|uniref:laccase-4-like isoform X2 n=1 Tax=Pseudomyrmex gracilis TaxID=219809 RepID=UPI0009958F08|nr:laccase-4-like isoform X2 [Pseudomyrmex gracilis]
MCTIYRLIFCATLIYCGVRSQIADDEKRIRDPASIEVPIEDIDNAESSVERLRPVIVGGVDDQRPEVELYCWEVDPPDDVPNLSSPLECARTCNDDEKPKTCYYRFTVNMYYTLTRACDLCKVNKTNTFCNNCQCVSADGVERAIITVNRMLPGPSIDVCEGDKVVVDVVNNLESEELTIHWHGLFQRDTQYYDGPDLVTQCPISALSTFRYQFNADNAGTHFWHSHSGLQKMDGVFGSLIVRQSQKRDVNSNSYDYDLSRHTVVINDWMHELASERIPGGLRNTQFQDPNTFLINGRGQYQDPETGNIINREIFRVERNSRYRFRMINAFCTTCSSILTVEGHNLTIIAMDGVLVEPTIVTSIISVAGERYDFVVNANNKVNSYWIQLRGIASCKTKAIQQLAVLQYEGAASNTPSTPAPTLNDPLPEGIVLNPLDGQCDRARPNAICVGNLKSAVEVDRDIAKETPDAKFYLPFKFYQYNIEELFAPNNFELFVVAPRSTHSAATLSDISFRLPPSPLLSQANDIPSDMICNSTHKPDYCVDGKLCGCTHVIELPFNGIVELVLIDATETPNLYHPFHLHGYAFNIISMGVPNNGTGATVDEIKKMDEEGLLPRRISVPPFKDTISVPSKGYAIVRFRANNPGYWIFHCHFIFHLVLGMANVFHVGEPHDLPPVPQGFPTCGNYIPSISP